MSAPNQHPDDIFHVILDALGDLSENIDRGVLTPWDDYDPSDSDPKSTREGYLSILSDAITFAMGVLSERRAAAAMVWFDQEHEG